MKRIFEKAVSPGRAYAPPKGDEKLRQPLEASLRARLAHVRGLFDKSMDLIIHELNVCGVPCAILMCEGLVSTATLSEILARPLTNLRLSAPTPQRVHEWVRSESLMAPDQKEIRTYFELFRFMMNGFVVLLIDGVEGGDVFGLQGFPGRSVGEPEGETNMRGSREGFNEMLRPNLGMVRRRFKTPDLIFEMMTFGEKSLTDGALIYCKGAVSPALLRRIRNRLSKVRLDVALETGYLSPFLDRGFSLFSGIGFTERPDTLCAKVAEGRVALLLDGTPFALIMPFLFNEHFQSSDDYSHRPYFATFIRWLKMLAFGFSALLPGLYVAIGTFHPELLPDILLSKLIESEQATPFSLMPEALIVFFLYEIMREAGLRMPKPVSHAVSIVGALVIGDAAVTAGIIGAPMVLVVALTAISSFVVPTLYEPVTILRFAFILLGGFTGLYGVLLGLCAVLVNLCAVNPLGVPAAAPCAPFPLYALRDTLFRWGWRTLAKEDLRVDGLTGSNVAKEDKS